MRFAAVLLGATVVSIAAAEEVRVSSREELVAALSQAKAGTTIRLAAGTYRGGLTQNNLRGTAEQPIVIAAEDSRNPPVIEGGGTGLHFSSPENLELRDLVLAGATGNGLNIDDGGNGATARSIVLRNLTVRDVGPEGNRDGIKLSGVDAFVVDGCRVERWGSGGSGIDMVGCHQGEIKNCQFVEARGNAANGVQAKGGSSEIVVRRCRFENSGGRGVNVGGSTGLPFFRPKDAVYEAKNITVEDCEFVGGMAAIAFVGCENSRVEHNTIHCPSRWPLRILQENIDPRFVACRNVLFSKNVVIFRADEVREVVNIGGKTQPETFQFARNVWLCLDRPGDTERLVRLPAQETEGVYGREVKLADAEKGDVRILERKDGEAGVR